MARKHWMTQTVRIVMWIVPGMVVMSSFCSLSDIRDNIESAGLGFVKSTATDVLNAFIPVNDFLPQ